MTTSLPRLRNFQISNIVLEKNLSFLIFTSVIFGGIITQNIINPRDFFLAVVGSNLRSITYFLKQCAAVTSHVLLIKVAPHWCTLSRWREACQGQAALAAMSPDIILLTINGTTRLPQPERDETIKF